MRTVYCALEVGMRQLSSHLPILVLICLPSLAFAKLPQPNDPQFGAQFYLESPSDKDINVRTAWNYTRGIYPVRVAILDSGIDYRHPDFGGDGINGSFGPGLKVRAGWDYPSDHAPLSWTPS